MVVQELVVPRDTFRRACFFALGQHDRTLWPLGLLVVPVSACPWLWFLPWRSRSQDITFRRTLDSQRPVRERKPW